MESRLDRLYDEISATEEAITVLQTWLDNLLQEKFSVDQVYQFLLYFDKLYAHFTDSEKKKFLNSFIERIEIYPEEQPDGRLVRSIRFKFPVWFDEGYTSDLSWDNETTVSRVIFLCQHRPDDQIEVELTDADFALTAAEAAATYEELKAFVKARYGFKITSLYKRKCGLPVGECYYHPKNPNPVIPQCPPEKEAAIRAALEHFQMLSPGGYPIDL